MMPVHAMDSDADGIDDSVDNCTNVANPGQLDADGDGHGNICDADYDNSCLINGSDLGILKAAFFTADPVVDMDGSGLVNGTDLGLFKATFFGEPGPSAPGSLCNPASVDSDGDGVDDSADACPGTPGGTAVDAFGCPLPAPAQIPVTQATSSTSGVAGGPERAVDGFLSTRWESSFGIDPSWLQVDLGSAFDLTEVIIYWEAASAATYEIQGSNDGTTWTVLASESSSVSGDRTDTVAISGNYRYVRMFGLTRTTGFGYSIYEMEIYGIPSDLLVNGSFESPDASGGDQVCSDSWVCSNTNLTVADSGANPDPQDGTQMLRQTGDLATAYQEVSAEGGQPYTATAWAQNFSGDALNYTVYLELYFVDANDNFIDLNGAPTLSPVETVIAVPPLGFAPPAGWVTLDPDTWTRLSATATAPPGTAKARILLKHEATATGVSTGSIFWDLVSLSGPASTRNLIWSDEFNGTSLDTTQWTYEFGYGNWGWGNDEWQQYTNSPSNIAIADTGSESVLRITANCSNPPNCGKRNGTITSARIKTQNKFQFRYGTVEARIKVPNQLSSWPAFWMLGAKLPQTGWPKAGEIDIMERFDNRLEATSAVHFCNEDWDNFNNGCSNFPTGWQFLSAKRNLGEEVGNEFRIFKLEWTPTSITTFVDGQQVLFVDTTVAVREEFQEDFFFILNLAVGGNPVADPPAGVPWPMIYEIDWIRVYQ